MHPNHWIVLAVFAASASTAAAGPHWSQWRGPDGQGVSREPDVPLEWGEGKNVAWKTEVPGRGHSSPIVWGDRLFLTTAIEGEVVPGAKPVKDFEGGQEFTLRDGVGADH